jgi:2,4-dienoyl-CoA reductase-like NADH-dependent reductase (Old Yellow Enzyme family)
MDEEDMKATVQEFIHAAKMALQAGFRGVEIHGANGYLLEYLPLPNLPKGYMINKSQFFQDNINVRTDIYGGSIENRCRFPLRIIQAVVDAVGPSRVCSSTHLEQGLII